MARTIQDAKLDTRAARGRLEKRREPHWRSISEGMGIGYRKGAKGGTWIARHYTKEHGRRFCSLGTADDIADADGVNVLSFAQAQEKARQWFIERAMKDAGNIQSGPYSVSQALDDYLADYSQRGGKALKRTEYIIDAHIRPTFGETDIADLTSQKIKNWRNHLAKSPVRIRTGLGQDQKFSEAPEEEDDKRSRKSSTNRILTVLKAALNHALHEGKTASNAAWVSVEPYKGVDGAKIRHLSDDEAKRLVNTCDEDLREIVKGALLTGCRYGELAAMKVTDYAPEPEPGTLYIPETKSGKSRTVALTDEGQRFFDGVTAGKEAGELIFQKRKQVRISGGRKKGDDTPKEKMAPWGHGDQFRPLREACGRAKINPAIGFHVLRHTYGSRLAMNGVPMAVIAAQLGHEDTRMTEKHYAHLAPSYVADTVRAAFGDMGIVPKTNVKRITRKKNR